MLTFLTILGCLVIVSIFLYALCKVSSDADKQAGYMEKHTTDVEDSEEEE